MVGLQWCLSVSGLMVFLLGFPFAWFDSCLLVFLSSEIFLVDLLRLVSQV